MITFLMGKGKKNIMPEISPLRFFQIAAEMFGFDTKYTAARHKHFGDTFGASPVVVAILWEKITTMDLAPLNSMPIHLLWSLFFMKIYQTNKVMATFAGASVPTFTKWVWDFIFAIAKLRPFLVSQKLPGGRLLIYIMFSHSLLFFF